MELIEDYSYDSEDEKAGKAATRALLRSEEARHAGVLLKTAAELEDRAAELIDKAAALKRVAAELLAKLRRDVAAAGAAAGVGASAAAGADAGARKKPRRGT